jgi:hypothetical protein
MARGACRAGGRRHLTTGTTGAPPAPPPKSVLLAGQHFVAALLYLIAGSAGLVWIAPELARGQYASPHVAGVTHLFTLGWLTTTIFGAFGQLVPNVFGVPLRWPRAARATFWLFVPGAGIFAAGIASGSMVYRHVGILLVALGVLIAVANIGASLRRVRVRDETWGAVALAISFLASTLVLGVALLHSLHTTFIAEARVRVLAVHLHVALVGWVLMMIVGFSHRLLSMFLVARGADTRWTKRSLVLLAAGVVALAGGVLSRATPLAWAGAALLEGGLGCFLWQARIFFRGRLRRALAPGMRFVAVALGFLTVSALIGPMVLAGGVAHTRLATAYIAIGLLGGIVLFVIGLFYRIAPQLAWIIRYRGRAAGGRVPIASEMFSARVAHVQLAMMAAAVVLLAAGITVASPQVARCGAALYLAAVLLFASQIAGLALRGRRTRTT